MVKRKNYEVPNIIVFLLLKDVMLTSGTDLRGTDWDENWGDALRGVKS